MIKPTQKQIKKYRPSNGTEGDMFMSQFCHKCIKFPHSPESVRQCGIYFKTMCYTLADKKYPHQWQIKEDGPVCTAYKNRDEFNANRRVKRRLYIATDKISLSLF